MKRVISLSSFPFKLFNSVKGGLSSWSQCDYMLQVSPNVSAVTVIKHF